MYNGIKGSEIMDSCYTYFAVIYKDDNFNLEEFVKNLNLKDYTIKVFSDRKKIEIGYNDKFNIDINFMLRETLKELFGKETYLLEMKEKYNLEYYLERVLYLEKKAGLVHPILGLDNDIVEFLYKTKTVDDLDYYI